jgi:hypothetical protein
MRNLNAETRSDLVDSGSGMRARIESARVREAAFRGEVYRDDRLEVFKATSPGALPAVEGMAKVKKWNLPSGAVASLMS